MYEYLQALHQRFFREPEHAELHEEITKQARYQLRYTRLFDFMLMLCVNSQSRRATNCATPSCLILCLHCAWTPLKRYQFL